MNIRESALTQEPKITLNIADLESVNVDVVLEEKEFSKSDGSTFKVKVFTVDEQEYRMPTSVLTQLKANLEIKPESTSFKVVKKGEGLETKYTVVML